MGVKRCPAGCHGGKKAHPTQGAAIHAALYNSRAFGKPFRVYRCPFGAGWHLTTKPRRPG